MAQTWAAAALGGLFVLLGSSVMAQPVLPDEISCYFNTVEAEDALAFGTCFTDDAEVVDVNRPIRGRAEIVRWADNEVMGGRYASRIQLYKLGRRSPSDVRPARRHFGFQGALSDYNERWEDPSNGAQLRLKVAVVSTLTAPASIIASTSCPPGQVGVARIVRGTT